MDDKTLQALTALANKLGTTAEYLWGVLLKQTPLEGTMSLILVVAWVAVCGWLLRFVVRNTTGSSPRWEDEGVRMFAWIGVVVVVMVTALICSLEIGSAVTAIVNPEYWALRQILK